jgi:uncharacterized protein YigA (DUF484 family)
MKFPHQALEKDNFEQLIEANQVKRYLKQNPDFLQKNPDLLFDIELSHQSGEATSLVERQVKVLREQNQTMQANLIELLKIAQNNERLLVQTNHFMFSLLESKSFDDLVNKIFIMLKKEFSLDNVGLVLVGDFPNQTPAKVFQQSEEVKAIFNCQFPDYQTICGRLEEKPKQFLFGELQAKKLESFALVPLGESCEYGLLVLASEDVSRFEPDMDTLFVDLIAKLVTHLTRSHLA